MQKASANAVTQGALLKRRLHYSIGVIIKEKNMTHTGKLLMLS